MRLVFSRWTLIGLLGLLSMGLTDDVRGQVSVDLKGPQINWREGRTPLGVGDGWLQVRDLAAGEKYVPVGISSRPDDTFEGSAAGLAFSGRWKASGQAQELRCEVSAEPPADRAIVVRVALPLKATGWRWWDRLDRSRSIGGEADYSNATYWGKSVGKLSLYMCSAVTGPKVGVSMAVPLHEPRIFRLAYSPSRNALEAEFDLGLSPDAKKSPCRAQFRLFVYSHDPQWGFRDAVRQYYELFPRYADRRVGPGGIWFIGLDPAKMACPWDWGLRFDESGQDHAGYDCAHDIIPFVYTEPWGHWEDFGNSPPPDGKRRPQGQPPIRDPKELTQVILDRLNPPSKAGAKPDPLLRTWAEAEVNGAVAQEDGSWLWSGWTDVWTPNHWLTCLSMNSDPEIPAPSVYSLMWDLKLNPAFKTAKKTGGEAQGVYFDSISQLWFNLENHRREHWQYSDIPLVASWTSKKPVLLHGFSCYELVLDVARRMRAENKFTMGNTFAPELIWFCPLLDMIGAGEMILGPVGGDGMADWHYIYMRVMGYRKPMSPLVYGLLSHKMTWEAKDRVMQCMLFYAMHPGAAGFLDPAKYEPTRPLFRFYEPIIAWLDLAGWQPITAAKADTASIERYGPGEAELADVAFIALRNLSKKAAAAHVTIEPRAFPKGVQRNSNGWALMSNRPVELSPAPKGQSAMPPIGLEPETTEVIVLGRRESIARLWMESARQWMDRLAREAAWLDARNAANDQKTDPARTTRKQIADVARRAAESLKNLADGDLLATINSQEPAYNQLRDLAASLPDEHQRRCLLLPTQNLADALGRAAEVLTGVTMGFPQNRPFVDAALGETITLKCDLRAGGKSVGDAQATLDGANGLDIRMPEKSPWGWEDVVVVARFQHENQPVWMTRRVTFRFQEKP